MTSDEQAIRNLDLGLFSASTNDLRIVDNEKETKARLAGNYAKLLNNYEYEKHISMFR